ncbi:MAG: ribulose-phosphate 3-epimerase [Bacteroidales bacterium]|nr:ribulose-phosphate 3-epimerase [Bacteroidales bacterium]HOY38829.1 ribulose-phosphate 3-epimerase [Bacteroidales bacterium]HQP04091.1 ribulose-phosphate 3-epimerase [Bacteroidales bacterium]
MSVIVAPSMLSANFLNLSSDIDMINHSKADWFHLDVMDGVFVPNLSFGLPVVKAIKKEAHKPLDVHLMIVSPEKYIQAFRDAGADILTVHVEACTHLHRTIQEIKNAGMKAGVSLNPHTPVQMLENVIADIDLVLVMSVNPGFGGQSFIQSTYRKLELLSELKQFDNPDLIIEVDGGVTLENAPELVKAGVNALVAGNTVFASKNPVETIRQLKLVG